MSMAVILWIVIKYPPKKPKYPIQHPDYQAAYDKPTDDEYEN